MIIDGSDKENNNMDDNKNDDEDEELASALSTSSSEYDMWDVDGAYFLQFCLWATRIQKAGTKIKKQNTHWILRKAVQTK